MAIPTTKNKHNHKDLNMPPDTTVIIDTSMTTTAILRPQQIVKDIENEIFRRNQLNPPSEIPRYDQNMPDDELETRIKELKDSRTSIYGSPKKCGINGKLRKFR